MGHIKVNKKIKVSYLFHRIDSWLNWHRFYTFDLPGYILICVLFQNCPVLPMVCVLATPLPSLSQTRYSASCYSLTGPYDNHSPCSKYWTLFTQNPMLVIRADWVCGVHNIRIMLWHRCHSSSEPNIASSRTKYCHML